jgi:hypothetical protein
MHHFLAERAVRRVFVGGAAERNIGDGTRGTDMGSMRYGQMDVRLHDQNLNHDRQESEKRGENTHPPSGRIHQLSQIISL